MRAMACLGEGIKDRIHSCLRRLESRSRGGRPVPMTANSENSLSGHSPNCKTRLTHLLSSKQDNSIHLPALFVHHHRDK